ncbi:hypothetical protein AGMMS49992_24660 [Clostridia bacterium]|nr:hypothetical protein AGMMS49992_24660 [Clostridia bacterium]
MQNRVTGYDVGIFPESVVSSPRRDLSEETTDPVPTPANVGKLQITATPWATKTSPTATPWPTKTPASATSLYMKGHIYMSYTKRTLIASLSFLILTLCVGVCALADEYISFKWEGFGFGDEEIEIKIGFNLYHDNKGKVFFCAIEADYEETWHVFFHTQGSNEDYVFAKCEAREVQGFVKRTELYQLQPESYELYDLIKMPLQAYPLLERLQINSYYGNIGITEYLSNDMMCTIVEARSNTCTIRINDDNAKHYAQLFDFLVSLPSRTAAVVHKATTYRFASSSVEFGYVDETDKTVWVCGVEGNRTQIIYKITSKDMYKLGWVDSSALEYWR